jgi:hypothetical protein
MMMCRSEENPAPASSVASRGELDRWPIIDSMMNTMAPGIPGPDRAEAYARAVHSAIG